MYRLVRRMLNPAQRKSFHWIFFWMVVASFFESLGLSLIIPYVGILNQNETLLRWIRETFAISMDLTPLTLGISCLFFGLITLKAVLQMYVAWLSSQFPYSLYKNLSEKNYAGYLHQSYVQYTQGTIGTYVRDCTHTIEQAAAGLACYLRYLSCAVTTVFLFALLFLENFFVSSLLILLFSGLGWLIHQISKKPQLSSGKEKEECIQKLYQWIHDTFLLFKEIRLYHYEERFLKIFRDHTDKLTEAYKKSVFYPSLPQIYVEWFAVSVLLIIVAIYMARGYPASEIVAPLLFYAAVGRRLLPILTQAIAFRIQMQHFKTSIESLIFERPHSPPRPSEHVSQRFHDSLSLRNVHFSYEKEREVLKGIDLTILKNESIALIGPSGGGKSTLAKLLMGLISPSQGEILIDGKACQTLDAVGPLIGYVPQEIALMTGTILENITLFEAPIQEERLSKALQMAQLEPLITSLPLGLQTPIGERGITLSGGQRQRLAIARALYQDPDILLFDEATSSLDNVSEGLITETIRAMSGKKTVIAIAHRLSTVEQFDRIYLLDEGKIVALGTHRTLLETSSLYRQLCSKNAKSIINTLHAECIN